VNYKPRGAFVSKRKLKGTLNVSGDFNNAGAEQDYNNCTSGPFPWVARLG
jgi:hypothetical protein